jgi:acyl-coenzyme A synthetase/AMP-(fatty) acid ligase
MEVYGCTEAGAIAVRRTTRSKRWELLEGYSVVSGPSSAWLRIPGVEREIELPDVIDVVDDQGFYLVGRNTDIVKIGGKRASLAGLVNTLRSISGVEDGLIFRPGKDETKHSRLAAIVVAPDLSEDEILLELSKYIDQVFLPRKIVKVAYLPYNDTGKMAMDSLYELFDRCSETVDEKTMADGSG